MAHGLTASVLATDVRTVATNIMTLTTVVHFTLNINRN